MYEDRRNRVTVSMRAALVGLIHSRSITIQDGVYDDALAVTLMSTDVENFTMIADKIHSFWSAFLEVIIGTYLLARQVGWMCLVPLIMAIGKKIPRQLILYRDC